MGTSAWVSRGACLAEASLERRELVVAGEVGGSVAGEHVVEDAEVLGDAVGEDGIGAGGEVELPAEAALLLEVGEQGLVVGEVRDVELDAVADFAFQRGFAAGDPAGNAWQVGGVGADHEQERVDERVVFDEGAIEVDAERPAAGGVRLLASETEGSGWTGCLG
jgi:hypothetical protein